MPNPSPLQQFARQNPPYTVPDETYRAALQSGNVSEADLREWGMSDQRIGELIKGPEPKRGCTNPNASNFNPDATVDDGTCIVPGCNDPVASNYNPEATVDDGSCEYPPIPGCMDPEAPNYNPKATIDDGSCRPPILGCMDREALNFNEHATKDDGSCKYPPGPSPFEGASWRKIVERVTTGELGVQEVLTAFNIDQQDWNKIQRHFNDNPIPQWQGTPVLPARKTDLWVLGISRSGKSAMLSAILGRLNETGVLLGSSFRSHHEGFSYRAYLENAYKLKVFPGSTQTKGFNFVPMDLLVEKRKGLFGKVKISLQSCNLIEMAGEKVRGVLDFDQSEGSQDSSQDKKEKLTSLEWLNSRNSKVITIVLDINSESLDQESALNRVFGLLREKNVLSRTEKIILLATKVDELDSFDPNGGADLMKEVEEKINLNFRSLRKTLETFYEGDLVLLPFSVGGDIVNKEFLRGDRDNHFVDNYIEELRMAIPVRNH